MKRHPVQLFAFVLGTAFTACVHTTPGTSVEIALARKATLVKMPATPAPMVAKSHPSNSTPDHSEVAAEAFSRGDFCMKSGRDDEAIAAFTEVVKDAPSFTDAWNNLAILYEKEGREDEALDAFRKAKRLASK